MTGQLIWDWDGTLGYHDGMFSGSMEAVLRRESPGYCQTASDFAPHLQTGFPWFSAHVPHTHIKSAEQWWDGMTLLFEGAFVSTGVDAPTARRLAPLVRGEYTQLRRFKLFDDSYPTLGELDRRGWTQVVLSNHVPELVDIVPQLSVGRFIARTFSSGCTGYEKPHPMAFRAVLDAIGQASPIWMIGDGMKVDILGAEAVGIPGILVRGYDPSAERYAEFVSGVLGIVG